MAKKKMCQWCYFFIYPFSNLAVKLMQEAIEEVKLRHELHLAWYQRNVAKSRQVWHYVICDISKYFC